MKIGLYGGTFDPIHNAHLLIAEYVKDKFALDKVIFIPASIPPHKIAATTSAYRFKMVEAAIQDNPSFECSRIEIDRAGKSFSYDTIHALKDQYQLVKDQIFWIIGDDNLKEFHTWHKPHEILEVCKVVVFPRTKNTQGLPQNEFFKQIIYLNEAPLIEISSSMIRDRVRAGFSIKYFVPSLVMDIILSDKLYL